MAVETIHHSDTILYRQDACTYVVCPHQEGWLLEVIYGLHVELKLSQVMQRVHSLLQLLLQLSTHRILKGIWQYSVRFWDEHLYRQGEVWWVSILEERLEKQERPAETECYYESLSWSKRPNP